MRLASICPSNTEILHYLGATQYLVAVDQYSDWPKEIQTIKNVGPDLNINMDELEATNPDLVLASLSVPGMEKNIEELKSRNIPFIILNPKSLHDIKNDIITVSKAIGFDETGSVIVQAFEEQISIFKSAADQVKNRPTLYWEWWPKPVFTPGGTNWLTEVSELVGAINVFHDIKQDSIQLEWDDVFKRNPDYICLAWVGIQTNKMKPELVKKRPSWNHLQAVQNHRILLLEEWLYCRPSPRLLTGCLKLGKKLHPEIYQFIELLEPFFEGD